MLLVLLVDRVVGLTSLTVLPQSGFVGGPLPGGTGALLSDIVTVLVVAIVLLVIDLSGRPRGPRAMAAVLVVSALVGLQLGATVAVAATGVEAPTNLELARALLLAATTMAALHLLSALVEHRDNAFELRRATAAAESLAASGREALRELRADVAIRVQAVLRDALAALELGGGSASGAGLRSLADEVLRPLSHRLLAAPVLAARSVPVVTPGRWRDTLSTLLRAPVVSPRILALLATGLAFLRSLVTDQEQVRELSPAIPMDAEGVGVALTVDLVPLLVVFGELALVLLVTRWGAERLSGLVRRRSVGTRPVLAWAVAVAGIGAVAALTVLGPAVVDELAGVGVGVGEPRTLLVAFIATLSPLLVVTVGVSLVAAVAADRTAVEAALAQQRTEATRTAARVQAVLGHEQRRIARSLHADVQATVNAAGLMLDRADRDDALTPQLVEQAAELIAASVERFLSGGASTRALVDRLAEVRALWEGLCAVIVDLDDAAAARIDRDTVTRELIVDLVTEACANAVVHGDATEVRVRIRLGGDTAGPENDARSEGDGGSDGGSDGGEIELDVTDDGTRRQAPTASPDQARGEDVGTGGLGTEVLRASCTSFTLDIGPDGGRLHALLPLGG